MIIEKVREMLDESIEESGLDSERTKAFDEVMQILILADLFKEEEEKSKNITISLEVPAAIMKKNRWGMYLNNEGFERLWEQKIGNCMEEDKDYIANIQLDVCLIDPLTVDYRTSGGQADAEYS